MFLDVLNYVVIVEHDDCPHVFVCPDDDKFFIFGKEVEGCVLQAGDIGSGVFTEFGLLCNDMMTEFGKGCFYVCIGFGGFPRWVTDVYLWYKVSIVVVSHQVFVTMLFSNQLINRLMSFIGWIALMQNFIPIVSREYVPIGSPSFEFVKLNFS